MITLDEARIKIDKAVKPLLSVKLPILETVGCCVALAVRSPINVPGFDCSIMDGIALHYDDLDGTGPWRIPIQSAIAAGDPGSEKLLPGHVVKIMTGAPLPPGADTVIKIEDISIKNNRAEINDKTSKGDYVRAYGDDVQKGEILFDNGTVLTAVDIGILASSGLTDVDVIPRPKITLLSTGSEIVAPGEELKPGQRYDANSFVLKSMFEKSGFPVDLISDIIPDKIEQLGTAIRDYLDQHDLLITTGGVSMGDYDYIPDVVKKLGGEILFHKVKIKPGKPVLVAKIKNSWLVGLPGNPVSVITGFHLFIKRIIAKMMAIPYQPRSVYAKMADNIKFKGTRLGLLGARLEDGPNGVIAYPAQRQNSGRLSSVKGINGLIILEEGRQSVSADEPVYAEWLY